MAEKALRDDRGIRLGLVYRTKAASLPGATGRADVAFCDLAEGGEGLGSALADCGAVIHLAAQANASLSRVAVADCWRSNVMGTIHLAEYCSANGVGHVVLASTAGVYGASGGRVAVETDDPAPQSIYAASKRAAEIALQGYAAERRIGVTIARLTNLYGGTPTADTVIGRALLQAAAGEEIRLDSLTPIRDFLHVEDAADALLMLAARRVSPGELRILNVGSGQSVSIRRVAEIIRDAATSAGYQCPGIREPAGGAATAPNTLLLDSNLLRELTGWAPRISLEQGLQSSLSALIGQQNPHGN